MFPKYGSLSSSFFKSILITSLTIYYVFLIKSHYLCILILLNSSKIKSFSNIQHVIMFLTCFFMIPIVFLPIIIVLNFLVILLIQVVIFLMCFYLVLNLTTKVRIFTYDWASPTGNSSCGDRRTVSYAWFDDNELFVVLGLSNDSFLLLLQAKSNFAYGLFVEALGACLAVGIGAGVAPCCRV